MKKFFIPFVFLLALAAGIVFVGNAKAGALGIDVSLDATTPPSQSIDIGAGFKTVGFVKIKFSNYSTPPQDISLSRFTVFVYKDDYNTLASSNDVFTLSAYDGDLKLKETTNYGSGTFMFYPNEVVIPANSSKIITIKGQITLLTTAQKLLIAMANLGDESLNKFFIDSSTEMGGFTGSSGSSVVGNWMNIIGTNPIVKIEKDSSVAIDSSVSADNTVSDFNVFKIKNTSSFNLSIDSIKVNSSGSSGNYGKISLFRKQADGTRVQVGTDQYLSNTAATFSNLQLGIAGKDDTVNSVRTLIISAAVPLTAENQAMIGLKIYKGNVSISNPSQPTKGVNVDGDVPISIRTISKVDTMPPNAPANIKVEVVSAASPSLQISWNNPADSDLAKIKIYRSIVSGQLGSLIYAVDKGIGTAPYGWYGDANITAGTTYYYIVRAVDTSGNESVNNIQFSGIIMSNGIVSGACVSFDNSQSMTVSEAKVNFKGKTYSIPTASFPAPYSSVDLYAYFPTDGSIPNFKVSSGTYGAYLQQSGFMIATVKSDNYKIFLINNIKTNRLSTADLCQDYPLTTNAILQVNVSSDSSFVGVSVNAGETSVIGRFVIEAINEDVIIDKLSLSADTPKGNIQQLDIYEMPAKKHIAGFGGSEGDDAKSLFNIISNNGILFISKGAKKTIEVEAILSSSAITDEFKIGIILVGVKNIPTAIVLGLPTYSNQILLNSIIISNQQSQITSTSQLKSGDVVKSPFDPTVYIIKDGKKQPISSPQEFEQSGYKWDQIKTVQLDLLKQIADLKAQISQLREELKKTGTLIKNPNGPEVYVIKDGKKEHITSPEEFAQKGYKWDQIQTVTSDEISQILDFTPGQKEEGIYSNGTLIKAENDSTVYIIVNGKKRPIPDPATFNNWGLKWDQIKEVPASQTGEFEDIKVSSDIIRAQGNDKIYRIIGDKKLWIPTVQAFLGSGYKPNSEIDISQDDIADFEDVKYIKVKGGRYVYEIKDNKKYRITDTSQIPAQDIKPVTLAEFTAYPIGK